MYFAQCLRAIYKIASVISFSARIYISALEKVFYFAPIIFSVASNGNPGAFI